MFFRIFAEMKIWKGNIYFSRDENFGGKNEQRSYQRKRTEKISSANQNTDPDPQSGCEKISPRLQKQSGGIYRGDIANWTMEDITQRFGSPVDIVHDYISAIDPEDIRRRLVKFRIIRNAIIIIVIAALAWHFHRDGIPALDVE